jgi:chromosomal replication initiation ATPase DnaA
MPDQFVLPFPAGPALTRETFIVAACNEQAFRFIQRWPDWPARAAALYGPAGCGKTHLAAIWRGAAGASTIAARDLAEISAIPSAALVIEDLDREPPSVGRDKVLLELFERPEGSLLFTGRTPPSEWRTAIGDLKSRLQSLIGFAIWAPDDAFLSALILKHFADRQLDVSASVIDRIITHVERTPDSIAGFITRADRKALSEKRPVTNRLVLELIDAEENRG